MYEVVVGIDFGSSASGFAYSYMDKDRIIHGQIYGGSVDNKVPTEIILDNNRVLRKPSPELHLYFYQKKMYRL